MEKLFRGVLLLRRQERDPGGDAPRNVTRSPEMEEEHKATTTSILNHLAKNGGAWAWEMDPETKNNALPPGASCQAITVHCLSAEIDTPILCAVRKMVREGSNADGVSDAFHGMGRVVLPVAAGGLLEMVEFPSVSRHVHTRADIPPQLLRRYTFSGQRTTSSALFYDVFMARGKRYEHLCTAAMEIIGYACHLLHVSMGGDAPCSGCGGQLTRTCPVFLEMISDVVDVLLRGPTANSFCSEFLEGARMDVRELMSSGLHTDTWGASSGPDGDDDDDDGDDEDDPDEPQVHLSNHTGADAELEVDPNDSKEEVDEVKATPVTPENKTRARSRQRKRRSELRTMMHGVDNLIT